MTFGRDRLRTLPMDCEGSNSSYEHRIEIPADIFAEANSSERSVRPYFSDFRAYELRTEVKRSTQ